MERITITPFPCDELRGQSLNLKVNYAHHLGFQKSEIIEKLNITNKQFIDITWLYAKGYKEKVIAFIEAQRIKKERGPLDPDKLIPFNELEDCSLTFKINYAYHLGVPRKEIMEKLNVTNKRCIDVIWKYENEDYRQRIINFLNSRKAA